MAKKPLEQAEEIKSLLLKDRAIRPPDFDTALSTGSTLLNLACTGRPHAGYVRGNYYFMVGDSNSGKSWFSLTALAEAANNPAYDDYRLIFDNVEGGVQMNLARHFGRKMADRLEPACIYKGNPWHSEQIEDFYLNLDDALSKGPCIYVLDSMDSLSSTAEEKKFKELKKASKKADDDATVEVKGSFTDDKAKKNSAFLRQMLPAIEKTGSILIIISQTRDNVGTFSFETKTRSGGRAPSFYAQVEVWSAVKQKLKRKVRDVDRHIGSLCQFHVKRSRFTGHEARVDVPIYFSAGIDDLGSCIDYLIVEKHWKKKEGGSSIEAPEFDHNGSREKLIALIEESGREEELRRIVAQTWCEIEEESGVQRKRRYI